MSNILRIQPEQGQFEGWERQMGQIKPAAATPTSIYSPAVRTTGIVYYVTISETAAGTPTVVIYHDDDGTTYNTTTEIYSALMTANISIQFPVYWPCSNSAGNIACESSTGNVTFTIYGVEVTA